ncbi:MAG: hypothetical protein KIT79_08250 [Deltaproteobacteria bacterium]|nr:hypothetical protein [Deltaproteobacteria bacterium]
MEPQLSPLARFIFARLKRRSAVIPQASLFIRDLKSAIRRQGYEIAGDELGQAFDELIRAGLAHLKVRKDYMGLIALKRFEGLKSQD